MASKLTKKSLAQVVTVVDAICGPSLRDAMQKIADSSTAELRMALRFFGEEPGPRDPRKTLILELYAMRDMVRIPGCPEGDEIKARAELRAA